MAARELAVTFSKLAVENNREEYLVLGTPENDELRRYAGIAVRLFPAMPEDVKKMMPIESFADSLSLFEQQDKTSDQTMRGVRDLTNLSRSLGKDKFRIIKPGTESRNVVIRNGYILMRTFQAKDSTMISTVRELAAKHKSVVAIPDFEKLSFDIYVSKTDNLLNSSAPGRRDVTVPSSSGGGLLAFFVIFLVVVVCGSIVWSGIRKSSVSSPPSVVSTSVPKFARVIKSRVNLRSQPNDQNKSIKSLSKGERLQLLSPNHNGSGWYNVRHESSGITGWVHGNGIEFIK